MIPFYKIVNTDNFGSDYPDEKFVEGLGGLRKSEADSICAAINSALCNHDHAARFWKVVSFDYELQPGFEP